MQGSVFQHLPGEFWCAPVGTGTELVRKPTGIYWVEAQTLTTIDQSLWDGDQRFGDGPNHEEADGGLTPLGQPPATAQPAQQHMGSLNPNDSNQNPPAPTSHTLKDHIKVVSLNIQGRVSTARDFRQEKWFEIYGLMNRHKLAVLAVQETHLTDDLADSISTAFDTKLKLLYSPLPEM